MDGFSIGQPPPNSWRDTVQQVADDLCVIAKHIVSSDTEAIEGISEDAALLAGLLGDEDKK
jgi:hypothetical protein